MKHTLLITTLALWLALPAYAMDDGRPTISAEDRALIRCGLRLGLSIMKQEAAKKGLPKNDSAITAQEEDTKK